MSAQLLPQFDLFGVEEGRQRRQDALDRYERRQRQIERDAGIDPFSQAQESQRLWNQLRNQDRINERYACDQLTGNAAARSACLEGR